MTSPAQVTSGQLPDGAAHRSIVESPALVPHPPRVINSPAHSPPTGVSRAPPHDVARHQASRLDHLGEQWEAEGFSEDARRLLSRSWRENTNKQYESAWSQWLHWCNRRSFDPFNPTIVHVVNFLSSQSLGKSYSTVNCYRSALSSALPPINGYSVGKHPLIIRLMKGIFNEKPPKPRYTSTWEVSKVLDYLSSLDVNENLDLLQLSEKLISLTALVSAQRVQTLGLLDTSYMTVNDECASFQIMGLLKTTSPKAKIASQSVELPAYTPNEKICVLSTLKEYLKRTEVARQANKETKLFLSTRKPHNKASNATIARWLKNVLVKAKIDASIFSAHSYRSAASSAAFCHGVSIHEIMARANWSNSRTFREFYFKPSTEQNFASTILNLGT
ncbi:uncharacterized protein [Diadema antillarum]|uniref:uncharacterized protein n=1 Tax=Diadema antillarum TaxID=105358 RepID=UPI003A83F00D